MEDRAHRPQDRLRARGDFLRVQKDGRRVHTPHFVIILLASEQLRLGVTVTRKVAGSVGRNRIKRVVREAFRLNRQLFPEKTDVVMVARAGADGLDYGAVRGEIVQASEAMRR